MPFKNLTGDKSNTEDPVLRMISNVREIAALRINDPEMLTILQHEIALRIPRTEIIQYLVFPLWLEIKESLLLGEKRGLFNYDI